MDDRQRLEEQALRLRRLTGVLVHGAAWRERRDRGTARGILAGVVLAAVTAAVIAGVSFLIDQLGRAEGTGLLG